MEWTKRLPGGGVEGGGGCEGEEGHNNTKTWQMKECDGER